jgi:hypothetical protein
MTSEPKTKSTLWKDVPKNRQNFEETRRRVHAGQVGKGDRPRNLGPNFRKNYDSIDWSVGRPDSGHPASDMGHNK